MTNGVVWEIERPWGTREERSVRKMLLEQSSQVMAVVSGKTNSYHGFGSAGRRRALRQTWFPSDHQSLTRLEEATGLVFRFVIGRTSDKSKMSELRKEVAEYDDFVMLDVEEEYSKLPYKTSVVACHV